MLFAGTFAVFFWKRGFLAKCTFSRAMSLEAANNSNRSRRGFRRSAGFEVWAEHHSGASAASRNGSSSPANRPHICCLTTTLYSI